jgi:hypothetical protein
LKTAEKLFNPMDDHCHDERSERANAYSYPEALHANEQTLQMNDETDKHPIHHRGQWRILHHQTSTTDIPRVM